MFAYCCNGEITYFISPSGAWGFNDTGEKDPNLERMLSSASVDNQCPPLANEIHSSSSLLPLVGKAFSFYAPIAPSPAGP